jgi:N-acetyl-anhydromuramoyl-L-alanine amidase
VLDRSSQPLWNQGWYRYARRCPSPNFGPRPPHTTIDLVVVHAISLPPGEYGSSHVLDLFTNQLAIHEHPYFENLKGLQVSAHFFIRRQGQLWQTVSCDDRAWHAGVSSFKGQDQCNDFSIGIELEGLDGHTFEASQYETLSTLCASLADTYCTHHRPRTHCARPQARPGSRL